MLIIDIGGLESPLVQRAEIKLPAHRHIDHASVRNTLLDQRDIDRELAIPLDKFLCAIQRIDQPKRLPLLSLLLGNVSPLLTQDREWRHG